MKKKECLVLWSGGLDSTVLLFYIKNEYGFNPIPVHFHYNSKQYMAQEEATTQLQKQFDLDVTHLYVNLDFIGPDNSLVGGKDVPEGKFTKESMKDLTVPFRNGIFLSYAASLAESSGFPFIAIGVRKVDSGVTYPDCTDDFLQHMTDAISYGTLNEVATLVPFAYEGMNKIDIVSYALLHNIDLTHTYSCYNGTDRPCLKCPTCLDRIKAFKENGVKDPALTNEEWYRAIK